MSQSSLDDKYGINSDQLRILKGQHKAIRKVKENRKDKDKEDMIRPIGIKPSISNDLYAALAIFVKLPLSWIQERVPKHIWTIDHFRDLSEATLSWEEFLYYLITTEEKALKIKTPDQGRRKRAWLYDIRGIILKLDSSHSIYIRTAIYLKGGYVIEIFSEQDPISDYLNLKKRFAKFGSIETGYFHTVIKNRINPAIVCKSRSKDFIIPNNLKRFDTL